MASDPIEDINPFPKRKEERREDRIRRRAYELWEAEGRPAGRESDHWLAAEREELTNERPAPPLGEPVAPGTAIPDIRSSAGSPATDGLEPASGDRDKAVTAPRTAGAAEPGPDTSRSRVANRDVAGPRKAGTSPRPTAKPIP